MASAQLTTAADLLRISSEARAKGRRCELIVGQIRYQQLYSWRHGQVAGALLAHLAEHIRRHRLGKIFGAETGFLIERNPDTVRAPDTAFIANANIPASLPESGYWPGAPDLAVEVISTNDRAGEIDEKIKVWLGAGVQLLWIVDPELQTVTAYRSLTDVLAYSRNTTLDASELLPGFSLEVAEIFR
ncbi:Uma2 family endonuclease [Aeoliella sp. SH292]|uniref:Uma2 family endonuclease n=1 Tax=Aeoliella sp. SH292 TaxID=3454464 RepID=UPI003F9DB7BB